MKPSDLLRPEYSSKIIGVLFISTGIYLLLFTPYRNAGLASLFIGVFTALIVNLRTVEEDTAISELVCSVAPLHSLVSDLNIRGNGVLVPPGGNLRRTRVFVPASKEFRGLPDLYDEMTLVTGDAGRVGVSLEPPGKPLASEAAVRLGTETSGIEGAREMMGMLSHGLGLARSFSVIREDDNIRLRITHGTYGDYCNRLREDSPGICEKTACPLCSAYLTALSESMEKPVRIVSLEKEDEHVKYTLRVLE